MVKNKQRNLSPLNTNVRGSATGGKDSKVAEQGDVVAHIEKLRQVSLMSEKLMKLVGEQLHELSGTVPVSHGFEVVKELGGRSKEFRDGIQDAFQPLRAHIEREKALFYTKNAEAIEKIIRERVKEGVKKRLPIMLKERLGHYKECLETNSVLADEVKQTIATTSARDANATLSPNHTDEEVALIPPHSGWNGLTLGNLKNIDGPAAAKLARDQGLTPSEGSSNPELVRIRNLNMILKHLGVQYRAIPSRNGVLLTCPTIKANH